jgi:polar amino acid transport system substrate-binding protein
MAFLAKFIRFVFTAFACASFLLFPCSALSQPVDDLVIMTEQYPPYNFEENGKPMGISVDTMVLILEKAGSKLKREDIKILPWARGYKNALTKPNTCLFSTTRTEEREHLFKWVGPVGITKIAVIAKKSRKIKIMATEDLNNYRIGVINEDIAAQTLELLGIRKKQLDKVAHTKQNIKKLIADRIDLWGYGENVAKWELKANGFDPSDYETVYVLKTKELYFAFHKSTSDELINRLQAILDQIKSEGEYKKILDSYLK